MASSFAEREKARLRSLQSDRKKQYRQYFGALGGRLGLDQNAKLFLTQPLLGINFFFQFLTAFEERQFLG